MSSDVPDLELQFPSPLLMVSSIKYFKGLLIVKTSADLTQKPLSPMLPTLRANWPPMQGGL
jgi:hypothetical protein